MVLSIVSKVFLTASIIAEGPPLNKDIDPNIAYNPRTAATIQCTIRKVLTVEWPHQDGTSTGICLVTERGEKLYTVIVAPAWHIGSYMDFKRGEGISISGSLRHSKGRTILVARLIKKGGRTLHLRTVNGTPHWESNGPMPKRSRKGRKGRGKGSKGGRR